MSSNSTYIYFEDFRYFICSFVNFHTHLPLGVGNDGVREAGGEVVVCNDILDPAIVAVHLEVLRQMKRKEDIINTPRHN